METNNRRTAENVSSSEFIKQGDKNNAKMISGNTLLSHCLKYERIINLKLRRQMENKMK
jgi:hypothetical protein